ncbi:hypothetical protein B0A49_00489 [Cryomyces minteri]|uniref:Uncharacterized protein n=1 Tax=Cryomyces minteri TaxID=331657 RepID=A0A4V5NJP5_9PEZI|nr:hypothetical protein B0A49_00489 [Cryomyces minteri]
MERNLIKHHQQGTRLPLYPLLILFLIPRTLAQHAISPLPTLDAQLSSSASTTSTHSPSGPATSDLYAAPSPTSPASPSSTPAPTSSRSLLNFYFAFLALLIALLALAVFFIHRRQKAAKARSRYSGQTALARDLDGWAGSAWRRRWVRGGWGGEDGGGGSRGGEGLNEEGMAPPPYEPGEGRERDAEEAGIAIPLRTLGREHGALKPPEYAEAVVAVEELRGPADADSATHAPTTELEDGHARPCQ